MPAADDLGDLRAPVPYDGLWTVVGIVLLVVVVLGTWALLRPRRASEPAPATVPTASAEERRARTLEALDGIGADVAAGRTSARDAGHATAAALRGLGAPEAVEGVLGQCRPWQFRPRPPGAVDALLRSAREAVLAWTP